MTKSKSVEAPKKKRSSHKYSEEDSGKPLEEGLLKWWIGRKPSKVRNIWDGSGLFIRITTTGKMIWKLNYSLPNHGKRSIMTLGYYSQHNNLEWARKEAVEKTAQARNNIDPYKKQQDLKKLEKNKNKTFKEVADLWYEEKIEKSTLTEESKKHIKRRLFNYLYPEIGKEIYKDITQDILKEAINKKYKEYKEDLFKKYKKQINGSYLFIRIASDLNRLGKWAKNKKYSITNPAENLIEECKWMKAETKNHPAITEYKKLGEYLNKLDSYEGKGLEAVKEALIFITYIPVRSKELRQAKVKDLDLERNILKIPKENIKTRKDFDIPLSNKIMDMLKQRIKNNGYKNDEYIFQLNRSMLNHNIITNYLRRIGYSKDEATVHGFRSTFSTLMRDADIYNEEIIERNLSHSYGSQVSQAYNRGTYIEKRRQCYEDYGYILDGLKEGKDFNELVKELKRKHFAEDMKNPYEINTTKS